MTISLTLSQEDRNRLVEERIYLEKQNTLLDDSNKTSLVSIAEKLKNDVPFKKQTDAPHIDLYLYEEELRRLNGLSLPQPLQEQGFIITSYLPNSRLYINDGRMIIEENSSEIANFPIIPFRGYSWSSVCGTNFDIWSRDRKGSTTSKSNVTPTFTVDVAQSHLKISIDGIETEFDIGTVLALETDEQINAEVFVDPAIGGETDFTTLQNPVRLGSTSAVITRDVTTIDEHDVSSTESQVLELIEGTDYTINSLGEVQFNDPLIVNDRLEFSYDYIVQTPQTVSGLVIASSFQSIALNTPGFENVSFSFYDLLNTFTVTSGTGGDSSTAVVLNASVNDMRNLIGFDVQKQIVGKYQNNLLNVEIDGVAAEIEISDFRKCETDPSLGDNNDEAGIFWSSPSLELGYYGRSKVGPLFCSGFNNGNEVAESIQAKLREVGSGGFKNSICYYFDEESTFIIYSGTFGIDSSVHILPASDSLRDVRTLLGFNPYKEEKGNEIFYGYLDELVAHLNTIPDMIATELTVPTRLSHSIIYLPESGAKFSSDWQDLVVVTSKIYDDGSRGLPRLYPNGKVVVDSTNNKINFFDRTNVERTITLYDYAYSEGELIKTIVNLLNDFGGATYSGDYDSISKKFWIRSDGAGSRIFSLLWNSGKDAVKSIGLSLGFNCLSDKTGSLTYWSDNQISFSSTDFFYPQFCSQFYGTPMLTDNTVDEKSAILKEQEELNDEINLLNRMKDATQYDNENLLNSWEQLVLDETNKTNQEFTAVRTQRGCYGTHISESDTIINQQTTELASLNVNRNNLFLNSSHGAILNRQYEYKNFVLNTDFTKGGSESLSINVSGGTDKRIYNNPVPMVKYSTELKTIPGRFNNTALFSTTNSFVPELLPAFKLSNSRVGTKGFSYSDARPTGLFTIVGSDTSAVLVSTNSETYDLSDGDTIQLKIDGGTVQTATIDATPGYVLSRLFTTSGFVVRSLINDSIDFVEGSNNYSIFLTQGMYSGPQLATEIQNQLNFVGSSNYTVDYNVSFANRFTITSDGSAGIFSLNFSSGPNVGRSVSYTIGFNPVDKTGNLTYGSDSLVSFSVISGVNDNFTIRINGILSANPIVISQGNYSATNLLTEMQNQIANDSSFSGSEFVVLYILGKFFVYSTRKGTASTVDIYEGTNDFLQTILLDGDIPVIGGGDVGNVDAVTATEISNILNVEITGIIASNDSGKVKLETASVDGSVSSIEVTGGTAISAIGFPISIVYGIDKNNMLKTDIDSDSLNDAIYLNGGNLIPANTVRADIQVKLQLVGTGGYAGALCSWNENIPSIDLTNRFRILSGSYGVSSAVSISDKTIYIQTGINDSFDFEETGGMRTFTIPQGFYNSSEIVIGLQNSLNSVGVSNYTVTYNSISNKLTIISDGVGGIFNLRFETGSNSLRTVAKTLGFYKKDHFSFLTYISDGLVKTKDVRNILGFDIQTAENGHGVVDVLASFDGIIFYSDLFLDTGGGTVRELEIDVTTAQNDKITELVDTINNYDFGTDTNFYNASYDRAFLLGRVAEKFSIEDNDTLIIEANGIINTKTFSAVRGVSISATADACTRIYSGINDRFRISVNGLLTQEIILGTLLSGQKIADKIQQEVRSLYNANIESYVAYLDFYCVYTNGKYTLYSGTGGTGSSVVVSDGSINDAAGSLQLGVSHSGYEADGTGDVVNSKFVTLAEIVLKLNSGAVGYSCSGTNYLKIQSTVYGVNTRIKVSGTLLTKLGFDFNDDDFPSSYFSSIDSLTMKLFSNISIKNPINYIVERGYEDSKGNIEIGFYSIDDQNLITRLALIPQRLVDIGVRIPQIDSRIPNVQNALTPALYQQRIDAVRIRLNKKTGSYVKVGDEFKQKENSESLVQSNAEQIAVINSLL
jgi:hypothetical protein